MESYRKRERESTDHSCPPPTRYGSHQMVHEVPVPPVNTAGQGEEAHIFRVEPGVGAWESLVPRLETDGHLWQPKRDSATFLQRPVADATGSCFAIMKM